MRRLFIMRKDLHMSPGKLAAQVGHCAEAYWTRKLSNRNSCLVDFSPDDSCYKITTYIDPDIYEQYIEGAFVKTVCQARNKNHLLKAAAWAEEHNLVKDTDCGLIYDKCLTELEPEEEDGTTLTGVWFKPLPDDLAHEISKKYHLYI